jgi:glucose/arabinose dehydrogenase
VTLRVLAAGFASPIAIASPRDGTNRLFVVEQRGTVRTIQNGRAVAGTYLDLRGKVTSGGEQGLLGLAFHPGFRCNGRLFVDYTNPRGDTVVAEYAIDRSIPDRVDPASARVILRVPQPFPNHNGGQITFGPDGMLYVALGDGGGAGDSLGNGQNLQSLLGKLLRLDVDAAPAGEPYVAPGDTCRTCGTAALPEIYAYGLRNPWRFSFDRATGDLWIGDVGQNRYEEIDAVALDAGNGANFGWNRMEGRHCFRPTRLCNPGRTVLPVVEYDHSRGDCAVVGGYVYRGSQVTGLGGWYVFADFCSGTIRAVEATLGGLRRPQVLLETHRGIASFGEGEVGELYVADMGSGEVLQLTAP